MFVQKEIGGKYYDHLSDFQLIYYKREVPKLLQLNPTYAVTAFHAYAHSVYCQMSFNPKYLNVGKTVKSYGYILSHVQIF
jgi:hypothetical protein